MKNIFSYKEFLVEKNQLNEGFWDWLKGLFKELEETGKHVQNKKEIDNKLKEYTKQVENIFNSEDFKNKINEYYKGKGTENTTQKITTQNTQESGTTNENFIFEAEETVKEPVKKEEPVKKVDISLLPDAPDFIKNIGKPDDPKNPMDIYFSKFLKERVESLIQYTNSKNQDTRLYVFAKIGELISYITDKKIGIYQEHKDKKNLDFVNKIKKNVSEAIKTTTKKLKEIVNKPKTNEIETGKIYKYTNRKGQVSNVYLKKDGTAVTTSDKGDKEPGEPIDKPNIKDTFKPIDTKLKPQEDVERKKSMADKLKKAGLDKIIPDKI